MLVQVTNPDQINKYYNQLPTIESQAQYIDISISKLLTSLGNLCDLSETTCKLLQDRTLSFCVLHHHDQIPSGTVMVQEFKNQNGKEQLIVQTRSIEKVKDQIQESCWGIKDKAIIPIEYRFSVEKNSDTIKNAVNELLFSLIKKNHLEDRFGVCLTTSPSKKGEFFLEHTEYSEDSSHTNIAISTSEEECSIENLITQFSLEIESMSTGSINKIHKQVKCIMKHVGCQYTNGEHNGITTFEHIMI